MKITIPAKASELLSNFQRIMDAFAMLAGLREMEVHIVPPSGSVAIGAGNVAIKGDPPNLVLPLPLQFTRAIADSTATAASVSAQLNLVLAELRKTGQLPS